MLRSPRQRFALLCRSAGPPTTDSPRCSAEVVSPVPEPDLQVVRPSVGRPPAQEGKRHIDEEDQNAHREDISADGRHQVPDIERPQIHSRQPYALSHDVSRDEDGGTDKRQPEMNYPEKVGIATASDLGQTAKMPNTAAHQS